MRVSVFEQPPTPDGPVAGMGPREKGYLVTEERLGVTKVVASLGFFSDRAEALARFDRRSAELRGQGYRPVPSAGVAPVAG